MKRYKVLMVGINKENDLIMGTGLLKEEAEELKKKLKEDDYRHYYEIKEMEGNTNEKD